MESVVTFMEIFTRNWKDKNNDALARILKDTPGYLQNVPMVDAGRALEILFDDQKGLFKFIQSTLNLQKSQITGFNTSLKEVFIVLQFIMEFFKQEYEPYIMKTRNVCLYCIKTFCWFWARKAASETFKKLIELFPNYDMQLNEVIEHYIKNYSVMYTKKDGCVFYIVLGAIAKHSPKTENLLKSIDEIFLNLLNDFKSQHKPNQEKQPDEIKIYLDCFLDMFVNFVPYDDNTKKHIYFEKLYSYLSQLCEPNKAQKVLRSKAIYVLSSYMEHFSPFVFKDYKKWHLLFNNILEESENYTVIGVLRAFYKIVASHLLKENSQDTFLYFKNYLILNLCNKNLSSKKMRLIVYGLGELSIAYPKYAPTEIYEMFQMISFRTLPFYANENQINQDFEGILDYMRALSYILFNMPNISSHQVNIITELSIQFIKRFPELKMVNKKYATNTLKIIFLNINHLEKNFQHEYFHSLFREGILLSCSHTLHIDIELQQEIQDLPVNPISYKDYLPLWLSLFRIDIQEEYSKFLIFQVFDEFISILLSFIEKLNLNVKIQENSSVYNTAFALVAENETDFRFFINLIDLYVDILEEVESSLLKDWTEKLSIYFIKYSYKYPLISGFYKLITVIFKKFDVLSDDQDMFSESTIKVVPQYLSDVLEIFCGFTGELQLSCIYMIFNTPICYIKNLINKLIPVFKIAFNIGLTELPVAFCALNTLENWIKSSNIQFSNDFLKNIIFYIEPYLSSEGSSTDIFQDLTKNKKENVKSITIFNTDQNLEDLQKKILLFYGLLDLDILFDFVHEKSIHTNATWNKKNLLQCELLFPDIRLEIYFDNFISRIIELTKSGDRKTKVSACELLHTMITIILGKKLDQCFNKNLCYAVLRLGCDPDAAAMNLYRPLVIQLSHYFSSKLMKESRVSQDFVDSLFDGLIEEFNSSLRDYCGLCLKEFVEWSDKQSTGNDLTNIRSIIRRITNFALYPSNKKRIAAAIAFNHLYVILRENPNIVNIYWLEFLYTFVKSMEECDDLQIVYALSHVEKVIKVKSNIFNAKSSHRRKPPGFSDETLKGTLVWLFSQCSSINAKCRIKCMDLFESLLPLIPEGQTIKNLIINNINEIALKNLEENFESITISNAKTFLKCLDFYIWIMKKKLSSFDFVLRLESPLRGKEIFLKCFRKFVYIIVNQNLQTDGMLNSNTLMEVEELINLMSETTLKILEFISVLLEEESFEKDILWHDNLYLLITYCTLYPEKVGLTIKKLEIIEKLPRQLETLLALMMKQLPEEYLIESKKIFLLKSIENFATFTQIHEIINLNKDVHVLKQFVEGLLLLRKCKFYDFEKEHNLTTNYLEKNIINIFESLKFEIMDSVTCKKLEVHVKDYLEELMNFFLADYQLELVKFCVKLIINNDPLINLNGSIIEHGEYFLEIFNKSVSRYLLKNPVKTMEIFDDYLIEYPDKILSLIEKLLLFAQHNKTGDYEYFANEIIKRCNKFQRLLNDVEYRKEKFFNINRIAIILKHKPIEAIQSNGLPSDLYLWILEELVNATDLEKKAKILQSFLICLTDEESNQMNPELLLIFQHLRDADSEAISQKLKSDEILKFQLASCFKVLLKGLVITKSSIVYQSAIKFASGIYAYLFKESVKEFLTPYFANISNENALKSLQLVYKIFMDMTSSNERLDVLKHFLLPSMELNTTSVIEKFYKEKCEELIFCINKKIDTTIDNVDRKKLIVSKIGCYNIFELMFAKFELKFISINDPISQSEKLVNRILMQQALNVRCLSAVNEEEKEIIRLLHCAALNCSISIVSLKEEELFYKFIFLEDREKNQLIWEKIVDCSKKYDFQQTPSTIRKDRKKLINIRKTSKSQQNPFEATASYFHRYDLTSSTLLEDVHAYDLNDLTVLASPKISDENDERLNLSFENDELNNHDCMPMITGVLVHMFNNDIASLPDVNRQVNSNQLPDYFKFIRNAFATQKDNVRLFLMKVICNTKNAFLPYVNAFFTPIVGSIIRYLQRNHLNYIIRDVLIILIESKYVVEEDAEKNIAQELVECLLERTSDPNTGIYKYNLEIIESLCKLWSPKIPQNLSEIISANRDLAIQAIVILLRNCALESAKELLARQEVRKLIENSVQHWKQSEMTVQVYFEAVGWLLRLSDERSYEAVLSKIVNFLSHVEKQHRDRCAQCVCAIFKGCSAEPQRCKSLVKFANPKYATDNHKAECFELFYHRISDIGPLNLTTELMLIDLKSVLRERILACEGPALKIVERLLTLLPESEFRIYLDLVLGYTGATSSLLENRRLAYSILMETYLKYPSPHVFGTLCIPALVRGLDDPAEEIQEFVLTFWREKLKLPETCFERLIALLDIYVPELQDSFPRFLCLMMLELTSKSFDSNRPMFKPLTDCTFQDYQLFIPRRRANLGSMAPLFAPSLASQLGQLSQFGLSQQSTFAATMQLLATRDLEFEPTVQNLSSSSSRFDYKTKLPDPSQNKLSKRMITEPNQFVYKYSQEAIQRKSEYHEKLKKEVDRQRNSAKYYRKYRIGDFPDVELTQTTFVESLRRMIMRDWLICKDLAVALICSIIERLRGTKKFENLVNKVSCRFGQVLKDQRDKNNFAPVVLEIVLQALSNEIKLDVGAVQKICKINGLHSLGILLLEKNILSKEINNEEIEAREPPAKRMRFAEQSSEKENWIELAKLYKCQGEVDIVNSIFKLEGLLSHEVREAVLAQAESDWLVANNSYEIAYEEALGSEKEYCLEGMFECLAELSSWGEINKKIEIILNGDYDSVWKNSSEIELLPWIFEAQLHKALDDYTACRELENEAFIQKCSKWIQKSQDVIAVRRRFGEEMSVLFLCDDRKVETARHCLKSSLDNIRDQWIRLSPLSEKIRTRILLKLRGIRTVHDYINVLKSSDLEEETKSLIQNWDKHSPSLSQDLLSWNKHVSYRLTFSQRLYENFENYLENTSILKEIRCATARQRMKMSEVGMKNNNNVVAKKHIFMAEKIIDVLDDGEFSKLNNDFTLTASKYKFFCSRIEKNVKKQCKYFVSSWEISQSILEDENAHLSTKINAMYHLFDLTSELKNSAENNPELLNLLKNNEFVINITEAGRYENRYADEVLEALQRYSFNILKRACGNGSNDEMAKSYTQFGKYCYDLLQRRSNRDSHLLKEFISSLLNAMSLGSLEAAQYFPCLLKYEYYWNNEEIAKFFIEKSENVPSWMFLSWQTQIMSYLSKPLGQILIPIVQRLIKDYPNGVMYNFRQTYEAQPDLKTKLEIREMYESLFADSRLETFFKALHYVCQPEHYLRHNLLRAVGSIETYTEAINSLFDQILEFSNQEIKASSLQGLLYKELDKYRVHLEKLKDMDYDSAKKHAHIFADDLYKAMKQRLNSAKNQALQLKDYSPYLGYFSGEDFEIEIPGQYSGERKPMPRYHTKILKFDRFIRVMESKCNPIKVNVIGNNANIYGFLIKFGEDLRQDQRLQQIFEITNKTLDIDIDCKRRYLSINTYQVVPLSTSLGLIQWVDQTKSLKEFVEFSMENKEVIETAKMKYQNWIDKVGKPGQVAHNYKNALLKYNSKDVISKMKELINLLEWDCLRKTFVMLSPSLECFVSLRRNFITSYATMCAIHWITGVGDRHLENMLIEVKTGKCYGIDFGSAFGMGIEQTIPELVPFRLTAQILGLLKPFDENALFGVTMTHVLKALRKEKDPILACLDVFIHEPLDWGKHLNKEIEESEEQHVNNVKWLPRQKIAIVEKKLSGVKPSTIMLEELNNLYKDIDINSNEFLQYKHIIEGTDFRQISIRSKMKNSDLTSKEQVQCLLEQATDLNALGHMYVGWCPFV